MSLRQLIAALGLAAATLAARADYPDHPVRLVLPFAAGGSSDAIARTVGPALAARLGQPVVIENRAGADGAIAGQVVASAPADGYTLLYAVSATAALPVMTHTSYTSRDFTPVGTIGFYEFGMFVTRAAGTASVREFIDYVKANPGKVNFATLNLGEHHAAALFMHAAGVEMTKVSYRSMGQIVPDLVSGQVHVNFGPLLNGMALAKSAHVKVLATLGRERSPFLPDVPTMAEAGLPSVAFESTQMLLAPAKTPRDIVERLSLELNAVLAQPEIRSRLETLTLHVKASTPDELRQAQEVADVTWSKFARESGLRTE